MKKNISEIHHNYAEDWRITLIDTGYNSGTGGRLKRVRSFVGNDDFCFTYGDGVSDVNIKDLISFHRQNNRLATVTAVLPPSKYGILSLDPDGKVTTFEEKPEGDGGWINGGFFVLSPKAIDYIEEDEEMWEHGPMKKLVKEGQLSAYEHRGFWHPMDTLRDNKKLNQMWSSGNAQWKVWK